MSLRRNHPVEWALQAEYYAACAPSGPELIRKRLDTVTRQVEIVFSDERLRKLKFLRKYMKGDPGNWLPLDVVSAVHRVRITCDDVWEMVAAVKTCSTVLEVDEAQGSIRRVSVFKYVKVADRSASIESVSNTLSAQSDTLPVAKKKQKDGVLLEFGTTLLAEKAVEFFKANGDWRGGATYYVCDRHGKKHNPKSKQVDANAPQAEETETAGTTEGQKTKKKKKRKKNKGAANAQIAAAESSTDDQEGLEAVNDEPVETVQNTVGERSTEKSPKTKQQVYGLVTSLVRESTVSQGEEMVGFIRLDSSSSVKGVRKRGRRTQTYEFRVPAMNGLRVGDRVVFYQVDTTTTITEFEKVQKVQNEEDNATAAVQEQDTRPSHLRLGKALGRSINSRTAESPGSMEQAKQDVTTTNLSSLQKRLVTYVQARGPDRSGDIGFTSAHWRSVRRGRQIS